MEYPLLHGNKKKETDTGTSRLIYYDFTNSLIDSKYHSLEPT